MNNRLEIRNTDKIVGHLVKGGITIKNVYIEWGNYLFYIEGVNGDSWAVNLNREGMGGGMKSGMKIYKVECITNGKWVGVGRNRIRDKKEFVKVLKELIG